MIRPVGAAPAARVFMIAGSYGSGKTEVAVNLAIQLAAAGVRTQIADLDLVNPYFRCREARALMERHGVRVVVPSGGHASADLPIVLPEIAGLLQPPDGTVTLFDVGGDDVGARVLASFRSRIDDAGCEFWQVVNSKRPFTDTVQRCNEMRASIETASRLPMTGLLVNTHLIEFTTPQIVLDGWRLGQEVSLACGLPIRGVAVMEHLADDPALASVDAPVLRMARHMLPPWLVPAASASLQRAGRLPVRQSRENTDG